MVLEYLPTWKPQKSPSFVGKYSSTIFVASGKGGCGKITKARCEQKHADLLRKQDEIVVFQSQTPISCPAKILIWYLKNQDNMERSTTIWASMQENWWKRPKNGLDESEDPERDRVTTFEGPFFYGPADCLFDFGNQDVHTNPSTTDDWSFVSTVRVPIKMSKKL